MKCYVYNRPDPQALAVNAFSIAWNDLEFYASRLSASSHKRLAKLSGESDRGGGGAALASTGLVAAANQAASAGPCATDSAAAPVPTGTNRH